MIESLINPKKMDKGPIKMFFIGMLYALLSLLIVKFGFSSDPVLVKYSGMIVVTFCVMFSLPFMYFLITSEEDQDEHAEGFFGVWKAHSDAIFAFIFLFFGFIVAFSIFYILFQDPNLFNAQIETYCAINGHGGTQSCVDKYYSIIQGNSINTTGAATNVGRFLSIVENNIVVMIATLLFSLVFGAGAIFVLAWNASVISAAISLFAGSKLSGIPSGLFRYMIHGFPEIAAYFITALAGGIFGVGILRSFRDGLNKQTVYKVIENSVILLFIALIILIIAGVMEVYLTPLFFS